MPSLPSMRTVQKGRQASEQSRAANLACGGEEETEEDFQRCCLGSVRKE